MVYNVQFGMVSIQPHRHMTEGDKMNPVHPGGIFFNASEPVFQQAPIAKPLIAIAIVFLIFIFLPLKR